MMLKSTLRLALTIAVITTNVSGSRTLSGGTTGTTSQKKGPSKAFTWGYHAGITLWSILTIGIFALVVTSAIQSMIFASAVGDQHQVGFLESCYNTEWLLPMIISTLGFFSALALCFVRHNVSYKYDTSYKSQTMGINGLGDSDRRDVTMLHYGFGFAGLFFGAVTFTMACGDASTVMGGVLTGLGIGALVSRPIYVVIKWCRKGVHGSLNGYPGNRIQAANSDAAAIDDDVVETDLLIPKITAPGLDHSKIKVLLPDEDHSARALKKIDSIELPELKNGAQSRVVESPFADFRWSASHDDTSQPAVQPSVLRRRLIPTLNRLNKILSDQ